MFARNLARQLGQPSPATALLAAVLWNRRNKALNLAALQALSLAPDDRVLEIGFGGGYLLGQMVDRIADGFLSGVDIAPAMVALGKQRFRQEIKAGVMRLDCAPVEHLPYPPGIFTKVCSINSIFYWRDIEMAFQEIGRVLLRGGRLVLCFTQQESLERKSFADHIHRFETGEVVARLGAHGFRGFHLEQDADRHRRFDVVVCTKTE